MYPYLLVTPGRAGACYGPFGNESVFLHVYLVFLGLPGAQGARAGPQGLTLPDQLGSNIWNLLVPWYHSKSLAATRTWYGQVHRFWRILLLPE